MPKQNEQSYTVVFRYTEAAGGYKGVTTQSDFGTQAGFEKFFADMKGTLVDGTKFIGDQKIIAEGCSQEEALKLVRETSLLAYVRAGIEDAKRPDGTIDTEHALLKASNAAIMFGIQGRTNIY